MVTAAVITFAIGVALMLLLGRDFLPSITKKTDTPTKTETKKTAPKISEPRTVTLYFGNSDGKHLVGKSIVLKKGTLKEEITETLELLKKPDANGLYSALPEGTSIKSVKITGRTATINFSKELKENHPGGSTWELLSVYAIVDTVTLGFSEVDNIQILVEGRIEETLAGHVMINKPLSPNRAIIKD